MTLQESIEATEALAATLEAAAANQRAIVSTYQRWAAILSEKTGTTVPASHPGITAALEAL